MPSRPKSTDPSRPLLRYEGLGQVARAMARAERMESVLQRMAQSALALGGADGVFVERVDEDAATVVVAAAAGGWGLPPVGTEVPYPGSLAETVLESDAPEIVEDLKAAAERPISRFLPDSCQGLVLPLLSEGEALGALVLVRRTSSESFDLTEADPLRTLADLGALTLRRQIVLQEAVRREAELEASERRFRLLLDSVREYAIYMLDPDGRIVSWNPGAERVQGYPEGAVLGRHCSLFYPEEDRSGDRLGALLRTAEAEGRANDEGWHVRSDGARFWASSAVSPVREDDGRLVGFAKVVHDLSEQRRVAEELERGRRRLTGVLDALPVGVFIADPDGRIVEVNRAARELWGGDTPFSAGPEEYDRYRAYWPGSDVPLESHEWGLALALAHGTGVLDQEVELETPEGRRRTLLNHAVPVHDADGKLIAGVAVNVDISEQRRAQSAANFMAEASRVLASSLDHDRTLREVARLAVPRVADWCAIYMAGASGTLELVEVAHADPAQAELARRLLRRYPPQEGAEAGAHKVFRTGEPDFLPEITEEVLAILAQDEGHRRLLGEIGLSSAVVVPMSVGERRIGAITLAAGGAGRRFTEADLRLARELADRAAVAVENARLFREVTRRAEEEEALRSAAHAVTASSSVAEVTREIAVSALEATGADGAFVEQIEAESGEVVVTAAAGEVAPEEGARVPFASSVSREVTRTQRPRVVDRLAEAPAGLLPGDLAARCGDCSAVFLPLTDGGELVGALALLRRADRPPFAEDELARARTFADLAALAFRKIHLLEDSERRREELEEAIESRARLIRGLTHDLRTPLGAADGIAALLEAGHLGAITPKAQDSVARLRRALRRATGLMDDLLEFVRAASGDIATRSAPVDLRDVASEMLGEYRAQGEARGQQMRLRVPDELPAIRSDPSRIRQILGNLISNAVKYTREGGRIEVTVDHRLRGSADWLTVAVRDSGPGIPPERQEEVFREFARLQPDLAEGSGLGLAISRRLAEALGGELTLESEPGRGSTFTLWLPQREVG